MRYVKKYTVGDQVVYLMWQKEGFWDLFVIQNGVEVCINLGEPLYDEPTLEDVKEFL